MAISLKVNGTVRTVDVPPEMPLLWALRDELDLKGTKYGCGVSRCGACTIHVNGLAARSCQTTVGSAVGKDVITIEGLSPDGVHAVQKAWEELDVPQCGYCQAGQIMAAAALLSRNAKPTDTDIDTAMNTNLCRCTTYIRIKQAIHRAAEIKSGMPTPAVGAPGTGKPGSTDKR